MIAGYFALGVLTTLVLTIMATLVVPNPYRNDLRALIKKAYNTAREMFSPQADERLVLGESLQQVVSLPYHGIVFLLLPGSCNSSSQQHRLQGPRSAQSL